MVSNGVEGSPSVVGLLRLWGELALGLLLLLVLLLVLLLLLCLLPIAKITRRRFL